jgi:hypothetical protein
MNESDFREEILDGSSPELAIPDVPCDIKRKTWTRSNRRAATLVMLETGITPISETNARVPTPDMPVVPTIAVGLCE